MHASGVVLDGRAVLLLGPAGAGKSSLAAALLRAGGQLLSDDVVALRLSDGALIAHAGSVALQLRAAEDERLSAEERAALGRPAGTVEGKQRYVSGEAPDAAPLGCVFLLERSAREPAVERLEAVDPFELIASTFNLSVRTPARLRRQLDVVSAIASSGVDPSSARAARRRCNWARGDRPRAPRLGAMARESRRGRTPARAAASACWSSERQRCSPEPGAHKPASCSSGRAERRGASVHRGGPTRDARPAPARAEQLVGLAVRRAGRPRRARRALRPRTGRGSARRVRGSARRAGRGGVWASVRPVRRRGPRPRAGSLRGGARPAGRPAAGLCTRGGRAPVRRARARSARAAATHPGSGSTRAAAVDRERHRPARAHSV